MQAKEEKLFWNYSNADKIVINWGINEIDWEELFGNKTVETQVSEFN